MKNKQTSKTDKFLGKLTKKKDKSYKLPKSGMKEGTLPQAYSNSKDHKGMLSTSLCSKLRKLR